MIYIQHIWIFQTFFLENELEETRTKNGSIIIDCIRAFLYEWVLLGQCLTDGTLKTGLAYHARSEFSLVRHPRQLMVLKTTEPGINISRCTMISYTKPLETHIGWKRSDNEVILLLMSCWIFCATSLVPYRTHKGPSKNYFFMAGKLLISSPCHIPPPGDRPVLVLAVSIHFFLRLFYFYFS